MAAEAGKKKKAYFFPRMDITLVMEVLQRNPFKNGNGVFGAIAEDLKKREGFHGVEKRTLQERVERLLKSFRAEQMQGMRRSGTEEEYDERERLLQDLSDLEREWGGRKREAAPSTAADQRKKAAKLHAAHPQLLQRLAAPLRPMATATATAEEAGPAAEEDARQAVDEMAAEAGEKKKAYFFPRMDIALVMEVLQRNPFKNGNSVFGAIAEDLKKRERFHGVKKRTLQERVERLLKSFRAEQMQGMRRSGTEEEYDERERLLQDLSDLEREWGGRKREAAPSTAADQRKKAAKLHAAGPQMLQRLAAPLRPMATATATAEEAGPAAQEDAREAVDEAAANDSPPAAAVNNPPVAAVNNPPPGHEDQRPPQRKSFNQAARYNCTLKLMQDKWDQKEEYRQAALDLQTKELQLRKDELDVRKLEVANELKRIEALEAEQKRRAEMEEKRRKEEREERKQMMEKQNAERKEMMDRQDKLMDTMLQLLQAKKN